MSLLPMNFNFNGNNLLRLFFLILLPLFFWLACSDPAPVPRAKKKEDSSLNNQNNQKFVPKKKNTNSNTKDKKKEEEPPPKKEEQNNNNTKEKTTTTSSYEELLNVKQPEFGTSYDFGDLILLSGVDNEIYIYAAKVKKGGPLGVLTLEGENDYVKGVNIIGGDLNKDDVPELITFFRTITGCNNKGNFDCSKTQVRIYDGADFKSMAIKMAMGGDLDMSKATINVVHPFSATTPFTGEPVLAVGDIAGTTDVELIAAGGSGLEPTLAYYDLTTLKDNPTENLVKLTENAGLTTYDYGAKGVNMAVGKVISGEAKDQVVIGPGPGVTGIGIDVKVLKINANDVEILSTIDPGEVFEDELKVAVCNLNTTALKEVVVAGKVGSGGFNLKAYSLVSPASPAIVLEYVNATATETVVDYLTCADFDDDGKDEIIATTGGVVKVLKLGTAGDSLTEVYSQKPLEDIKEKFWLSTSPMPL